MLKKNPVTSDMSVNIVRNIWANCTSQPNATKMRLFLDISLSKLYIPITTCNGSGE